MKTNLVAVDLAKRCYQVCILNAEGRVTSNRAFKPLAFARFVQKLEPTTVAMEACASAHFWGRRLQALGHQVRLVPPQHAKAFRRVHKSDNHDALSIAEAVHRPNLHFVPVKTIAQQDLQLLGRIRELQTAQRTALINQARGIAREYGVHFPPKRQVFMAQLPVALEDAGNELSDIARTALASLYDQIVQLSDQIDAVLAQLEHEAMKHPAYPRLMGIPGVGKINAPALLAALGDGRQFDSGRHCAAWVGLVPRQHGTGGKVTLGSITKNGDRHLRVLLIHGARAVIRWADRHTHAQSQWIRALIARRGKNKATVALANKMIRIVWAVLTTGTEFNLGKAYRPQPARC